MSRHFHRLQSVERTLTFAAALVAGLILLGSLLAADPPATPCAIDQLEKAKSALKDVEKKIAELDKDPRKPAAGKFTKDYENDKAAADADVKLATTGVTDSQTSLEKARKAMEALETTLGVKYAGQSATDLSTARDQNDRKITASGDQLAKARAAQTAFGNDAQIKQQANLLAPEMKTLKEQMTKFMDPALSDPILDKIDNTEARKTAQRSIDDDSYAHLEFTGLTPDGDVRGHAERLLDVYGSFGDRQTRDLRRQLQEAVKNARNGQAGAVDELRRLGPELIQDINRCRGPVQAAFVKVAKRMDAIDARQTEIDENGVALIAKIPQLEEEDKKLRGQRNVLDSQMTLAGKAGEVKTAELTLETNRKALEEARKAVKAADLALTNYRNWDALIAPWMIKKKSAEADVGTAQTAADAEAKAKDAALAQAKTDFDAVVKDIRAYRDQRLKSLEAMQALKKTDATAAAAQAKEITKTTLAKQQEWLKKLGWQAGIKKSLAKYNTCYKDVDDYITKTIDPLIFKLGGDEHTAAGVGELDDPFAGLKELLGDTPAVVGAKTGPVWILDKPEIQAGTRMKVSGDSAVLTVEKDGKTQTATIHWEGVKGEFRDGDKVTLTMDASGEAWCLGWFNVGCASKMLVKDNNVATWKDGKRTGDAYDKAKLEFLFESGSSAYIQVQAGQEPGTSRWASITWKFKKKEK